MTQKQKVESRKWKSSNKESFQLFPLVRLIMVVTMAINSEGKFRFDSTLFSEQFKPELTFVGFLECAAKLGYELII